MVPKIGIIPKWMVKIMENPKMDDLGVPLFLETPILQLPFYTFTQFTPHLPFGSGLNHESMPRKWMINERYRGRGHLHVREDCRWHQSGLLQKESPLLRCPPNRYKCTVQASCVFVVQIQESYEKNLPTFHYTSCFMVIGILIMAYYNSHISG